VRARYLLLATVILAGCGSTPKPPDPPRLRAALETESDGARRFERGDHVVAARRFDEAARIYASIDDDAGTVRNRLHLARTELARGRAEAALLALPGTPSLESNLLKAQAELALNRLEAAHQSLAAAASQCTAACPQLASLRLLQARAALMGQRAAEALAHAEGALKLLQDRSEAAETGNAWRLIAAARLAAGDATGALPAANAALDIDRRLAVPEKIARDWLLIGDIRKALGAADTAAAYRRAADVANAAGLDEVSRAAAQALAGAGSAVPAAR
jgi:tetratricopeptide (TPR) repeat protein